MGKTACILVGVLIAGVAGAAAWFLGGPFAGTLATAASFGIGSIMMMVWESQGRT